MPTLPKLADHAPFAPVFARMTALNGAHAAARDAHRAAADRARTTGTERDHGAYEQAVAAAEAAKLARDQFGRTHYHPAEVAAQAAVLPKAVADLWRPAVEAAADACRRAAGQVAAAVKLRDGLVASGLPVPHPDALPADLFGDPTDAWSPLGRLLAAARELAAAGK